MVKPKQRRLIDAIKGKTQAKVFYHGCGAVFDLIPDLIDIGVDIINPIQVSARGMDTRHLKTEYGRDIASGVVAWIRNACCHLVHPRKYPTRSSGGSMIWPPGEALSLAQCTTSRHWFHPKTSSRSLTRLSSTAVMASETRPFLHTKQALRSYNDE